MMFYYCGVDFTDTTYEISGEDPNWDLSNWTDVKFTLGFEYPNLPYLKDGDTKLTEAVAIMQYIARKWNPSLLGTNAAEFAKATMMWAQLHELKIASYVHCYTTGDPEAIIEASRPLLQKFVEVMGDDEWLAGKHLTWVDFAFAENLDMLDKAVDGLFYAEFPKLQAYWDRFIALPKLAEAWNDGRLM